MLYERQLSGGDGGSGGEEDGDHGVSKEDDRFANWSLASNFGSALVPSQYGQLHRKMVNWSENWSIGQLGGNFAKWSKGS